MSRDFKKIKEFIFYQELYETYFLYMHVLQGEIKNNIFFEKMLDKLKYLLYTESIDSKDAEKEV